MGRSRATGVWLLLAGVSIVVAAWVAPIPDFGRLERRDGVVADVRAEEIRFCRPGRGDCVHTMVDVDDAEGTRSYNFGQTLTSDVAQGEPIAMWVAPAVRGLSVDRVWHAEQGARVIREHSEEARVDRTIRWVLLGVAPLFLFGGLFLVRRD